MRCVCESDAGSGVGKEASCWVIIRLSFIKYLYERDWHTSIAARMLPFVKFDVGTAAAVAYCRRAADPAYRKLDARNRRRDAL